LKNSDKPQRTQRKNIGAHGLTDAEPMQPERPRNAVLDALASARLAYRVLGAIMATALY